MNFTFGYGDIPDHMIPTRRRPVTAIWKYALRITDEQVIEMPKGACIRHVGLDPRGVPCLWAQVEPERPTVLVPIYVVGTGNPVPGNSYYLGSFTDQPFVWHVYREAAP